MQRCTPAQVCTLDDAHTQPGRPPSAAAVSASMARTFERLGRSHLPAHVGQASCVALAPRGRPECSLAQSSP